MNHKGSQYIKTVEKRYGSSEYKRPIEDWEVQECIMRARNEVLLYECEPQEYERLGLAIVMHHIIGKYEEIVP